MISLKELENRVYVDRKCTGFDYSIVLENKPIEARFRLDEDTWRMTIVLDMTRDADSQVYKFNYVMPKENLPLELIAATGLKYFQLYLKDEIQQKSNMDITLGDVLAGM